MSNKKQIRNNFRNVCLKRDKYSCKMCGLKASSEDEALKIFDVHHIEDRSNMPNQGYCLENGITLCHSCHEKAEIFHSTYINLHEINDIDHSWLILPNGECFGPFLYQKEIDIAKIEIAKSKTQIEFLPENLYLKINSSYEEAYKASLKLKE